jgi:hypothetical protein
MLFLNGGGILIHNACHNDQQQSKADDNNDDKGTQIFAEHAFDHDASSSRIFSE